MLNSTLPWKNLVGIFGFLVLGELLGEGFLEVLKGDCIGEGSSSGVWSSVNLWKVFKRCTTDVGLLVESLASLSHFFVGHGMTDDEFLCTEVLLSSCHCE